MKFVMTQSICPEGIEKLKADTNGQVEIIAEDNPDPNNLPGRHEGRRCPDRPHRKVRCPRHENSPNLKVIGPHRCGLRLGGREESH